MRERERGEGATRPDPRIPPYPPQVKNIVGELGLPASFVGEVYESRYSVLERGGGGRQGGLAGEDASYCTKCTQYNCRNIIDNIAIESGRQESPPCLLLKWTTSPCTPTPAPLM